MSEGYAPKSPDLSSCRSGPIQTASHSHSPHLPYEHASTASRSHVFNQQYRLHFPSKSHFPVTAPQASAHDYQVSSPKIARPQQYYYSYDSAPSQAAFQQPRFTAVAAATSAYSVPIKRHHDSERDTMPPRKKQVSLSMSTPPGGVMPGTAGLIESCPVKTKFPTARIKRIMQADEEVGKVAQQTPIAVGKALELFMIQLVSKSADVARDKSSKRVSAQMLRQVVESDDQWDFLREIVGKVDPEEKPVKGRVPSAVKSEATSSDDDYAAPAEKKGRPGRKKIVA